MSITRIVLTGGPCAGKTTAINWIQKAFTEKGYKVLFMSETATELISGGVSPWTCGSNLAYQICQMKLQFSREEIYLNAAKSMPQDKILIICDRGEIDNKAYMTDAEFQEIMKQNGWNEIMLKDRYDAVFHLVTAAKGAEEFYIRSNNAARKETVAEAIMLDEKTIQAWLGHTHLRIIDNSTGFQEKMERLIAEISLFLTEEKTNKIKHTFLIDYPEISALEKNIGLQKVDIIETFINPADNKEIKVYQRGIDGNYSYFKRVRKQLSESIYKEEKTHLSEAEYLELLMNADTKKKQTRKVKYYFIYNDYYFEIDIYPLWKDKAILKINLTNDNSEIVFPKDISVVRKLSYPELSETIAALKKAWE